MIDEITSNIVLPKTKDCFYAFLTKEALYDGYFDIPFIPQNKIILPKKLVRFDKINDSKNLNEYFVHFYAYDELFDGQYGIWNVANSQACSVKIRKNNILKKIIGCQGIIAPDYSLYLDMPRVMQIWNVYRSRAIGYYLAKQGIYVIPNVRWSDKESYAFSFAGIRKNKVVAVGTLGCIKEISNRQLFYDGFIKMLEVLEPACIILYGPLSKDLKNFLQIFHVNYIHFDADITNFYGGVKNGNEIK